VIVRKIRRKAQRQGSQPGGLRRQIEPRGIGSPDDDREGVECRIVDVIDPQKCIEATQLAVVREGLRARDVVGRGAGRGGDIKDPLGRNVEKAGLRVDETPDQPRTGDAVDLWPLAGDPAG
jgi:hypothetical protein